MEEKQEIWKPIPGFRNYEVSNKGQVKNISTDRIIKQFCSQSGSWAVTLSKHGCTTTVYVARLMLQAFYPIVDFSSRQVHYKDGNRYNIDLDNLEWKQTRKTRMYSDENICDLQERIKQVIEEWHQEILNSTLNEKDDNRIIKW